LSLIIKDFACAVEFDMHMLKLTVRH